MLDYPASSLPQPVDDTKSNHLRFSSLLPFFAWSSQSAEDLAPPMSTPVEMGQDSAYGEATTEASSSSAATPASTGPETGYQMEAMDEIIDAASGAKPGGGDAWGTTRESAEDIAKRIAALAGGSGLKGMEVRFHFLLWCRRGLDFACCVAHIESYGKSHSRDH